ncbi:MAG TPA: hypothetical protein VN282_01430 [Pyrinomonadaceae bacterium]|nr:hypothetical protein [Pyrinomonadaceae bacterium]
MEHEVAGLGVRGPRAENVVKYIPVFTALIAVAGFWFTVQQYNDQQQQAARRLADEQRAAAAKQAYDREQALLKPLLDRRLELYFAASEAAATVATSKDQKERERAGARFMQLYAGTMVIVEDAGVEEAMIQYHRCLTGSDPCDQGELTRRSLALASKTRDSIGNSFNVKLGDLKGKY